MTIESLERAEKLLAEAGSQYVNRGRVDSAPAVSLVLAMVGVFPVLADVFRRAEEWRAARERTTLCRDEFGWDSSGDNACGEWQDAEDAAADRLCLALAALSFKEQA